MKDRVVALRGSNPACSGFMNRRRFLSTSGSGLALAAAGLSAAGFRTSVAEAATASSASARRRLFLDASVVEEKEGLTRRFHALQKHPANPVLIADRPWETGKAVSGPYLYGTVLKEGDRLRMWYQLINRGNHIGYAESDDGVHWNKPELGLIEHSGSRRNNLVVSAADREATGGECHNPSVIHCPWQPDPDRRYALFGFDTGVGRPRVAFSADGLRWRYAPDAGKEGLFRSSDVVNFFRDHERERFVATWKTKNRRGRAVGVAWSEDGIHWSKPVAGPVFGADDLDPDPTQIYGMPAFPYEGLYLGQPWIYHARYFKDGPYSVAKMHEAQRDSPRHIDVQLAWSWDLVNWTRTPERKPFLSCGPEGAFDDGMVFTARAPVRMGDRLFFYYGGCDKPHDEKRVKAAIGLATLRVDGFCSMSAGADEGWLITRRESLRQPRVTINARTGNDGHIAAELLDRDNRVVPGFSRKECAVFQGDAINHELKWRKGGFPDAMDSSDLKIRFWLKAAELFSYQASR